ncbi:MAG: PQQ-like beta-propeller repeat protein [Planctomycetia bacterium]|nr:PQQ-like beta-propeller repeat protein [Planctomycetia bacterium]
MSLLSHALRGNVCWVVLFALSTTARAENWPGWRGPTGVGFTDAKDLPQSWDGKNQDNLLWKAPLHGVGNSSPVVWGDRVFVTTSKKQSNQEQDAKIIPEHHVLCFQASDGKELWRTLVPPGQEPMGYAIYAVPTPVTDGERIYCWFGSAVLAALDFEGKIVWRTERPGPFKLNPGICSSPILYEDTVILLVDQHGGGAYLQGIDKKTGEVKWEKKRPKASFCNSTPVLLNVQGKSQLIVCGSNLIEGLNPANGDTIWSCAGSAWGSSPAFGSGLLYIDRGASGPGLALDVGGQGDVSRSHVKWVAEKVAAEYSSPVICGDYIYRTQKPGILRCWKLSTGEAVFTERLEGLSILASPIATADGRVWFLTPGRSYVIKAGPNLEVLAKNELGGDGNTGASPAVANGRIYLRDGTSLYCIGKK